MFTLGPGHHLWIWARTDRDAPTPDGVLDSAAALMARILDQRPGIMPGSSGALLSERRPDGVQRYALGAARPVDVSRLDQRPPPLPAATAIRVSAEDQDRPFAVKATRPIFVAVDFDWRGPVLQLAEWPRRKVNVFGFPVDDPMSLDWLLLDAYALGEAEREDPGDRAPPIVPPHFLEGISAGVLLLGLAWFVFSDHR